MSLWELHARRFARWVRMIGLGLVVVLAAAAAVVLLYLLVAEHRPWIAAALGALIPLRLHAVRRDLRLVRQLCRRPRLHLAAEYLAVAAPCLLVLLLHRAWLPAAALTVAAAAVALLPQPHAPVYAGRIVRIARLGYSPEWTAGLRRRPVASALLATGVLLCTLLPYLGFPALYLAALCCVSLYTRNEPLELLLLPEKSPARLLTAKIRTACRNYFLLAAPFALLAALLHPEGLWLAALWAPLSALLLVYGVLAKYAVYDPAAPEAAASTASMLGLAGFIVWPLLPVTLAMLVSHALRAERNLNRYLYDYD